MAFDIVIFAGASFGPSLAEVIGDLGYTARCVSSRKEAQDLLSASSRALLLGDARLDPLSFAKAGRVDVVPVGPSDPLIVNDVIERGAWDWIGVPLDRANIGRVLELQKRRIAHEDRIRAELSAELDNVRAATSTPDNQVDALDPTEVAATVLHEVNNPLTAMMVYLEDLRISIDKQRFGRARESVNALESTLDHLRTVARSGRTLLRKTSGPGNAMAAIQAAVVMAGSKRNPKVTTHVDVNIPPVTLPTHQLAQILLNLVINAGHAGSRTVVISALHRGDEVMLDVIDDGAGMDAEHRARALEGGYTTKRTGSGIGLAMVQRLTVKAGGRIELLSQVGAGTQVRLHLPVAPKDA
ncbi:MAG: HAMP domain-containing histidine kinase [Proteobacteria bacterium]|nr:HAMP domain-containing histidine kinase [Pseudomonadota bacterium]MCP4921420.1 HAMP domain-containing histidine kinase [Pseudomonadota bacterium]